MNRNKLVQASMRITEALGAQSDKIAKACIVAASQLLASADEASSKVTRLVFIVDLKLHDMSGKMQCRVIDAQTGENILTGIDLEHAFSTITERNYKVLDAEDVLRKISGNFVFKRKPNVLKLT